MMASNPSDPVRDAAIADEIREHLVPEFVELSAEFVNLAAHKLADDGWQPAQSAAIVERALPDFLDRVLGEEAGGEAIDRAIGHGRRELFADIFDEELQEGSDRRTAFLLLAAIDRENAERVGSPETNYPGAWVDAAVAAVEAAAARGESSRDQIAEGFSALARAARSAANDQ
ncbi:MAG: hypothetical protein JO339_35325 [Alphaproteobacteria bacterium]|nr:hypothetical protein [Alphaproteobacteria bacterium]